MVDLVNKEEKALDLKEVGVKLIFYGFKISDEYNKKLILDMAKRIKQEAHPIKNSPAKPVVYVILPLSAYDYG